MGTGTAVDSTSTINFDAHRLKLESQIYAVKERQAQRQANDEPARCTHIKQRFSETIHPDNLKFFGRAHFVVLGCVTCKIKKRIELVVEH